MNKLSLTPLLRQSIGFDRFNDLFEAAFTGAENANNYPPYNIEKHGENEYRIVMAVAGFNRNHIDIIAKANTITITGKIEEKAEDAVSYLYRGIATRSFERKFALADHVKVLDATLEDGLLSVRVQREIPEEQKARSIPIKGKAAELLN
jgi:molecular chaperone IbpA